MITINKIGRSFGKALLTRGIEILNSSVPLNPKEITSAKARAIMKEYFPTAEYVFMDSKYRTISLDEWKTIDEDIREVTKKMWEAEVWDCYVPIDTAFALGLFFADGTCGVREGTKGGTFWRIVNGNLKHIKRAKKGLEKAHKDFEFVIKEFDSYKKGKITNLGERKQSLYCLDMKLRKDSNTGKRYDLIKLYRNMFYFYGGEKKIPRAFCDGFIKSNKAFLDGVIAGDGLHNPKGNYQAISMNRKNPVGLTMINWVLYTLGIEYKVDVTDKEYRIRFNYILKPRLKLGCDDKSYTHKYWTLRIFGIPQFVIVGDVYDLQGNLMFHHLFNGRIVDNEIYIFEPDGGLLEKAEKGQNFIKFGGRKYFPKTIEF